MLYLIYKVMREGGIMKILDQVLTINEAVQEYDIKRSALRKAIVNGYRGFKEGVNCRKTGGRNAPWLVTREIIEKYAEVTNQTRTTKGIVYVLKLKDKNIYKIGVTNDLNRRLKQISPRLPFEVEVEHTIKHNHIYNLEKELHERFSDKRMNGEWFRLNKSDLQEIREVKEVE